ncbi:Nba1p [Lachancea thermotolerans CBS 6340]|uniref:KLTH0C08602p n=1 Tax=Lachancea thermotolerans (strain ATCC 56472 / CBS 6340 / NRRL Y-8284) TaxID=559295 RepID=C5DEE8_LACTC|nr:KLTH0C08602p [Lachancea thermotolerans CBS 6340]CAR22159.1 KLTH0C08602p [Lachancea thermotolerans CBS 6340]
MNTNTKRLSAMIDSFHDDGNDDALYVQRSTPSSPTKSQISKTDTLSRPPALHPAFSSPMSYVNSSPGNRESLISDYSASIHEGVPVSYVVTKAGVPSGKDASVVYSAVNVPVSEETVVREEMLEQDGAESSPVGLALNLKHVSGVRSPLRLASNRSHSKNHSSIGSGNLASESGHSHNFSTISASGSSSAPRFYAQNLESGEGHEENPIHIDQIEEESDAENSKGTSPLEAFHSPVRSLTNRSAVGVAKDSGDVHSMTSSIVPSLHTKVLDSCAQNKDPDRSSTTEYNPSIPPRSRNRPKSHMFIKDGLEDIQNQLQQQILQETENVSRASTNKSSTYYSAADQDNQYNTEEDNFGKRDDDSYYHRPLPTVPVTEKIHRKQASIDREDTIVLPSSERVDPEKPPRLPSLPASVMKASQTSNYDSDDDYEDIVDETFQKAKPNHDSKHVKNTTSSASHQLRTAPHKNKQKAKRKREMRSFDIDTISQMLNVTKGTLIGSEFSNLGMKTEEKRALERLVDSLSRLTADMVLDPERFQEGMRRLEKATRALEGF